MFHKWKKIRQRLIHIAKALCMHAYNLCLSVLSGELPLLQCRHSSLMCPERWVSLASLPLTCHQCVLRVELYLLYSPWLVTYVSCVLSFICFTTPDLSPMCPASWALFASQPLTCHQCVLRVELPLLHSPWLVTNVSRALSSLASQPLVCHQCVPSIEFLQDEVRCYSILRGNACQGDQNKRWVPSKCFSFQSVQEIGSLSTYLFFQCFSFSPWCYRTGWLSVKRQVTHLLIVILS